MRRRQFRNLRGKLRCCCCKRKTKCHKYKNSTTLSAQIFGFNLNKKKIILVKVYQSYHEFCSAVAIKVNQKRLYTFFLISVFPGTPAAPGMPCQGEDSKYSMIFRKNIISI